MYQKSLFYYEQKELQFLLQFLDLVFATLESEKYQQFSEIGMNIIYFLLRRLGRLRAAYAQWRLLNGSYGSCLVCNQFIGYSQLFKQPRALLCIECQKKVDTPTDSL